MREISQTLAEYIRSQHSKEKKIFLVDVVSSPTTSFYFASGFEEDGSFIQYGGNEYVPFTFIVSGYSEDPKNSSSVSLAVANVDYTLSSMLEREKGWTDARMTIREYVNGEILLGLTYEVDTCTYDSAEQTVSFELGNKRVQNLRIPGRVFNNHLCPYLFRDDECQQSGPSADGNVHTFCSKLKDGALGCLFHKNAHRFGGIETLPRS